MRICGEGHAWSVKPVFGIFDTTLSFASSEPAVSTLFGVAVRSLSRVCTVDVGVGPSLYVAVTYPRLKFAVKEPTKNLGFLRS